MALKFRRGTTAQQSGSLAFGEPFVNTTLGTLLVGGPNGDIVLSAGGTGSTGNFGAISGSGLDITGNANIAGNLTLGGAITIGDASADTVNVVASLSSSLIPQTTNAFDLGSETKFWRDLYISTGSIKMVNPANNQVVTTITAVAGGGIQIGNVQITTASIAFVDNTGVVTQTVAQSSSVGSTSNYAETSSFNAFTSSQLTQNTALATISGSLILTASANTVSVANLNTTTASLLIETANLESFTSSINTTIKTQLDSNTVVSGSSQIAYASISSIPAGIVSGSSQVTLQSTTGFTAYDTALATITGSLISSASAAKTTNDSQGVSITNLNSATASLLIETANLETFSGSALTRLTNLETTSASLLIETANLESFTSSINTTIKSKLDADGVISGSSQITAGSTTNFATDVKTRLNAETVVSGSSQVTLSSTTGGGTSAAVQFGSLGIGMAASGTSGRIDATNDVVAFSSSDIRFKENIKPIENAIDKIRKISGNTYDWKEENKVEHGYEGNDVGVIAQEIEAVLPQLVQTRESGFKAVKYDKLVALLIEGIKEQQLQIEQLRIDLNNCTNNKGL
jgi:hypothetical protein